MSLTRPTPTDILAAAQDHGYHLNQVEIESFIALADNTLKSYETVDALYQTNVAKQPPKREYFHPLAENNIHGAWYVKTAITEVSHGPLAGKRIVIKDNVAVAGVPMANGSRSIEGYIPSEDATVVRRLLAAGATIVGKSVCEDLCLSGSSFTSATGPVKNPWDPSRASGGSSSGSAALVANGEADLAIGADQGGSIRMPASWCGIVGHKPTFGMVPYTGAFPIERTLDHIGPMGRSVRDVALMLDVIAGTDGLDSRQNNLPSIPSNLKDIDNGVAGLKIGLLIEGFAIPGVSDPEVDEVVKAAVSQLETQGATVGSASAPWHRGIAMDIWGVVATDGAAYQMLQGNGYGMNVDGYYDPEIMAHFGNKRIEHADALSNSVRAIALTGHYSLKTLYGAYYAKARMLIPKLTRQYDQELERFDVLIMPTIAFVAPPLPSASAPIEKYVAATTSMLGNTAPFNLTGHPATSIPAGVVNGLPVGMMIVARRFKDGLALQVAQAIENVCGQLSKPSDDKIALQDVRE